MLMFGLMMILLLVIMGVGAYVAVRLIAVVWNSRRDQWESPVAELGLTVDRSAPALQKPFIGDRRGHTVRVEYFSIPKSRYSVTPCASAEVSFKKPLGFSLEITKPEWLHQKAANLVDSSRETGHELLDNAFRVRCSHTPSLMKLLNLEMMDGQNTTILNDLLMATRRYHRVWVTDRSVTLGLKAEPGTAEPINAAIEQAIYLIERFDAAQRLSDVSQNS
jgi:hypothetical protein